MMSGDRNDSNERISGSNQNQAHVAANVYYNNRKLLNPDIPAIDENDLTMGDVQMRNLNARSNHVTGHFKSPDSSKNEILPSIKSGRSQNQSRTLTNSQQK